MHREEAIHTYPVYLQLNGVYFYPLLKLQWVIFGMKVVMPTVIEASLLDWTLTTF